MPYRETLRYSKSSLIRSQAANREISGSRDIYLVKISMREFITLILVKKKANESSISLVNLTIRLFGGHIYIYMYVYIYVVYGIDDIISVLKFYLVFLHAGE